MANQTIASVPPNVEDPMVLRRFLVNLIEQLDIVLGNRAGSDAQYVAQKELIAAAEELQERLTLATIELDKATLAIQVELGGLEEVSEARFQAIETKNEEQDVAILALETAGYITDAPADGQKYVRQNNAWVVA